MKVKAKDKKISLQEYFLGDIEEESIPAIKKEIARLAEEFLFNVLDQNVDICIRNWPENGDWSSPGEVSDWPVQVVVKMSLDDEAILDQEVYLAVPLKDLLEEFFENEKNLKNFINKAFKAND